jgi:hypothetical protein
MIVHDAERAFAVTYGKEADTIEINQGEIWRKLRDK